jgi:capsular polysaccharide biosynthesis protein
LSRANHENQGEYLDGPSIDWQEGPSLVESVRRYKWLIIAAALVGLIVAYTWSSQQPVRYEALVQVFLHTEGEQAVDPGRIVRSQAEYLRSSAVLDRAVELTGSRLTRKELENRLTVEPATGADLINVRVLDDTPQHAATLADTVVSAYHEVAARQAKDTATEQAAALDRRQRQLEGEILALEQQLRAQPKNPRLLANRDAKERQLSTLADQRETARRDAARADSVAESMKAAVPDEPAEPKPLRNAVIGAMMALIAAAGLAWWLNGRRPASEGRGSSLIALGDGTQGTQTGLDLTSPARLAGRFRDARAASTNGSPAGNGAVSGIADFDEIATSVQRLFHFLNGPSQRLYEEDLPQLAVEEIAHRFKIDMATILLDNAGEVQTMGSVGLRASRTGTIDSGVRHLIEAAARSGPRLVDDDELVRLSGIGLGGDQADSLALVPLVREQVGFGVLLAGRRHGDMPVTPLSDRELEDIADCTRDIVPYVWAWLLLRNLKLRLRTLQ